MAWQSFAVLGIFTNIPKSITFFSVVRCKWVDGDGTGGSEKKIGETDSREECEALVRKEHPTANGATYCGTSESCKTCYAEFGATSSSGGTNWQTCMFDGMCMFICVCIIVYLAIFPI